MNVLDRILYLQKIYYDQFNQSPTVIQIGLNMYHQLLQELDTKDEIKTLHGMRLELIAENTVRIEY